jgi:DHA2 family methylenomycin A resistance protein-like MFS transporter
MQPSDPRPARVLTVMCAGMFLVLLDVTIVNVALPSIGGDLSVDVAALQWIVDGYAVAIAGLLLAGGTLGDRCGHRRILLLGSALFGAASVACAVAPGVGLLIAGRVLQGVGGALLLPTTMAVIADAYPEPRAQARALGTWAAVSSLALPAGPVLGGALVGGVGWRWVFWINVPLVAATVLGTVRTVPATPGRAAGRFDVIGLGSLVLGLGSAVFAVIAAGRGDAAAAAVAAVVAPGALAVGLAAERRAEHPVLPLDLLRRPRFFGPNVVAFVMNLSINGVLFVAMLYLQDVRGYPPLTAGAAVLPLAVPLAVLAPVSGRLTAAYGPRRAVLTGCLVAAAGGAFLCGVRTAAGLPWLLGAFTLLGSGAGLVTASAVAAVVRATPPERRGLATGMSNTARQVGTATGVAVFGAVTGPAAARGPFVDALPALGVALVVLWLAAAAVAAVTVESARLGGATLPSS